MNAWIQEHRQSRVALVSVLLLEALLHGLEASLRSSLRLDPGVSLAFGVPLLLGIAWLSPRQMAVAGLLSWVLNVFSTSLSDDSIDPAGQFRLVSRLLFVALSIWMANVVNQRDRGRDSLQQIQAELQLKLTTSLKAAALVHEIRQPLTALQLLSRLLVQRLEQGASSAADLHHTIGELHELSAQANRRMVAVSNLLGCVRTDQQAIDLTAVVQGCLAALRTRIEAQGIRLSCPSLGEPVLVRGDDQQLSLLCNNLLGNAIEALEQVHPTQRQITIDLMQRPETVELVIADSGPGLPSSNLEELLLQSRKTNGLGLGLFLCRTIAAHHRGSLLAGQSQSLGGAELRLTLSAGSDATPRRAPARPLTARAGN